jgi:hypothetical protein
MVKDKRLTPDRKMNMAIVCDSNTPWNKQKQSLLHNQNMYEAMAKKFYQEKRAQGKK